jgi:uncharacterized membrane protein HdeD (DUF308 family)
MLAALAANWVFVLLRASIAMIFGIVALVWRGSLALSPALLFGAYALTDGTLALIVALGAKGTRGFGSLLFEAIVRIGVGLFVFLWPAVAAAALVDLFALGAALSGIAAISVAVALRRELTGEWPLPLAGTASILFAALLVVGPAPRDFEGVIGSYALLFGLTLLAFSVRLRQLAYEILRA